MQQIEGVRLTASSFASGSPAVDVLALVELDLTLDLFERWRNHPQWDAFVLSMKDAGAYPHDVLTLALASFLSDAGNDVTLHVSQVGRAPDLMIAATAKNHVAVEMKAPVALRGPTDTPLTADQADKVIRRSLKSAGTGSQGQLGPSVSGILAIGGFHLRYPDLDQLEAAARASLQRRPHLLGIALISIGVAASNTVNTPGGVRAGENASLAATLAVKWIPNPAAATTIVVVPKSSSR
jgi:hypothetical protein